MSPGDGHQPPTKELLDYIKLGGLDERFALTLLDRIVAAAHDEARDQIRRAIWKQVYPETKGVSPRYQYGWNDAIAASADAVASAGLGTCASCKTPISFINSLTGSRWTHQDHPADGHDALPAHY